MEIERSLRESSVARYVLDLRIRETSIGEYAFCGSQERGLRFCIGNM